LNRVSDRPQIINMPEPFLGSLHMAPDSGPEPSRTVGAAEIKIISPLQAQPAQTPYPDPGFSRQIEQQQIHSGLSWYGEGFLFFPEVNYHLSETWLHCCCKQS
jgi:hypothetical protein